MRLEKELLDIKEFFKEAIRRDKVASCYLFAGEGVSAKIEMARYLSKALNCRQALNDDECFCDTCKRIDNSNHPDVMWLKAQLGQKLKIENIRTLISRIYLRPYLGRWKVFVVEDAGVLTEEAQNAFLKTLEEPPVNCVIILMAGQKECLLSTVISRCQLVKFLSGAPLENKDLFVRDFVFNRKLSEFLCRFEKKIERQQLEQMLEELLVWFRDALVCKTASHELCANKENTRDIKKMAEFYSRAKLRAIINEIMRIKGLVPHNVNPKIALSALCLAIEEGI